MDLGNGKLNPWPYNDTLHQLCTPYCDSSRNLTKRQYCPLPCYQICTKICQLSTYKISSPSTYKTPSPPTLVNEPSTLSLSLIISLSLLLATFFLFFFYMMHKFYTTWYNSRQRSQRLSQTHLDFPDQERRPNIWQIRTVGLLPSVINTIALYEYKNGEGIVEGTECSVCLSEFQEDETLRLLPKCNHAFHLPCIDTWLSSHTNCPNCRADIVESPAASPEHSPPAVLTVTNPGEETQFEIYENNGELECRLEDEENGLKRNGLPFQPMRRSFSFDSLSANNVLDKYSIIRMSRPTESNMGTDIDQSRNEVTNRSMKKLVSSTSIGRSLQKGPILMKRSFSWSEKVLLSRHRRSQSRIRSSILPL